MDPTASYTSTSGVHRATDDYGRGDELPAGTDMAGEPDKDPQSTQPGAGRLRAASIARLGRRAIARGLSSEEDEDAYQTHTVEDAAEAVSDAHDVLTALRPKRPQAQTSGHHTGAGGGGGAIRSRRNSSGAGTTSGGGDTTGATAPRTPELRTEPGATERSSRTGSAARGASETSFASQRAHERDPHALPRSGHEPHGVSGTPTAPALERADARHETPVVHRAPQVASPTAPARAREQVGAPAAASLPTRTTGMSESRQAYPTEQSRFLGTRVEDRFQDGEDVPAAGRTHRASRRRTRSVSRQTRRLGRARRLRALRRQHPARLRRYPSTAPVLIIVCSIALVSLLASCTTLVAGLGVVATTSTAPVVAQRAQEAFEEGQARGDWHHRGEVFRAVTGAGGTHWDASFISWLLADTTLEGLRAETADDLRSWFEAHPAAGEVMEGETHDLHVGDLAIMGTLEGEPGERRVGVLVHAENPDGTVELVVGDAAGGAHGTFDAGADGIGGYLVCRSISPDSLTCLIRPRYEGLP